MKVKCDKINETTKKAKGLTEQMKELKLQHEKEKIEREGKEEEKTRTRLE